MDSFSAMKFNGNSLDLIDQRRLPEQELWLRCENLDEVCHSIEQMVVRGAPAIGCAAAFALVIDARQQKNADDWGNYVSKFERSCSRLEKTRPTAVNLFYAINRMKQASEEFGSSLAMSKAKEKLRVEAEKIFRHDLETCLAIGEEGARLVLPQSGKLNILTHCNTGSLATAGYGTALGVIRHLHSLGRVERVYVGETRPWLQGARLTAFELHKDGIPNTLITDSTAAYVMSQNKVDFVIVGADRIAKNGDTANKIGTYSLSVACKYHGIKFYVAAPLATIDPDLPSGDLIPIEQRAKEEVSSIAGISIAARDTNVYNPAFDVTPAPLIDGIITERGVISAPMTKAIENILSL